MGLFDFAKICLFSEVNGVVTLDGKPVPGVEVVRTAQMGHDNIYTDKTVTDEQGRYRFAARFTHSVRKIAPVEPNVRQKIAFFYRGEEYLGWRMNKHDYDINTEVGRPINLACELSQEQQLGVAGQYRYPVQGICIGDGMSMRKMTPSELE